MNKVAKSKYVLGLLSINVFAFMVFSTIYYYESFKVIDKRLDRIYSDSFEKVDTNNNEVIIIEKEAPFFPLNAASNFFISFSKINNSDVVVYSSSLNQVTKMVESKELYQAKNKRFTYATENFLQLVKSKSRDELQVENYLIFLKDFFLPTLLALSLMFSFVFYLYNMKQKTIKHNL